MPIQHYAGLRKIRTLVESYQRPSEEFDPAAAWTHQYDLFLIAYAGLVRQGTIRVSRTPTRAGADLEILTTRPTTEPKLKHYTHATLECTDDLLGSPRQWQVSTRVAAAEDAEPYMHSGMTKQMEFRRGKVHFSVGKNTDERTADVAGLYGCKFCMLDAVQRLPAHDGFSIPDFGLFDEYDQVRSGYQLEFRQQTPIQLKGESAELSLFTMTGPGQIPASYWRDDTGRLLFFVSGLEVYVLAEENGKKIGFNQKSSVFNQSAKLAEGGAQ